jgi:thiol-disulfide isomerase/thioredoxin
MFPRILLVLGLLAPVSGCETQPNAATKTPMLEASGNVAEPPSQLREVTAQVVDVAGYQAAIANHPGKVVLIDCWATWCIPCREAFPHTVELSRKYGQQGLVVMSLSFDDPTPEGGPPPKVLEFLTQHQAAFENYVSRAELATPEAAGLEIDDDILPHYKLYGRDGKLIKAFSGGDPDEPLTPDSIEAAVKAALN